MSLRLISTWWASTRDREASGSEQEGKMSAGETVSLMNSMCECGHIQSFEANTADNESCCRRKEIGRFDVSKDIVSNDSRILNVEVYGQHRALVPSCEIWCW